MAEQRRAPVQVGARAEVVAGPHTGRRGTVTRDAWDDKNQPPVRLRTDEGPTIRVYQREIHAVN